MKEKKISNVFSRRKKKAKSEGQWNLLETKYFGDRHLREYIKRHNKLKAKFVLPKENIYLSSAKTIIYIKNQDHFKSERGLLLLVCSF